MVKWVFAQFLPQFITMFDDILSLGIMKNCIVYKILQKQFRFSSAYVTKLHVNYSPGEKDQKIFIP